ncbi:MAG TPA: hypothetical protein VF407_21215, partial [Polyangiaceae bacterium]
ENDPHAGGPIPSFVALFEHAGGFDQVVVVRWDGPGNACNGYGYTFIGIDAVTKATVVSKDLPFCGGPDPKLSVGADRAILFTTADAPPNHGTGTVKGEEWTFANRSLRKVR